MPAQYNKKTEMEIQSLPERTKINIRQVAATMEISNMPLTQQCVQNMIDLCRTAEKDKEKNKAIKSRNEENREDSG